jgi:hypothetical protein
MFGPMFLAENLSLRALLCRIACFKCPLVPNVGRRHRGKFSHLERNFRLIDECEPHKRSNEITSQLLSTGNESFSILASENVSTLQPFGPISLSSLQRGKTILDALANSPQQISDIVDLSSRFYEAIPMCSRLAAPSIIDNLVTRRSLSGFINNSLKIFDREHVSSAKSARVAKSVEVDEHCPAFSTHV